MPSSLPVGGMRMSGTTTSGFVSSMSASSSGRSPPMPTRSTSPFAPNEVGVGFLERHGGEHMPRDDALREAWGVRFDALLDSTSEGARLAFVPASFDAVVARVTFHRRGHVGVSPRGFGARRTARRI